MPERIHKVLKITGCSDSMLWYANKIGHYVPYIGQWSDTYKSREPNGFINIVHFKDAEVVDDPKYASR